MNEDDRRESDLQVLADRTGLAALLSNVAMVFEVSCGTRTLEVELSMKLQINCQGARKSALSQLQHRESV